jgi:hypothetical protein
VTLSPHDDYLVHQTVETIRSVATSDRNFYDRYYFTLHQGEGDVFVAIGLGLYPNRGVMDAFVTVRAGDTQYVVRSSRELGADRANTVVGPISVTVVEGLRSFDVHCSGENINLDARFEGTVESHLEPRYVEVVDGRRQEDYLRISQDGGWTGTLRIGEITYELDPERWIGNRDHSWGVRPWMGEPEARGLQGSRRPDGSLWVWVKAQFDQSCVSVLLRENEHGFRRVQDAVRTFPIDSGREPEPFQLGAHRVVFRPGTRIFDHVELDLVDSDGKTHVLKAQSVLPVNIGVATGYLETDWRHGMYQGPEKVEEFVFDLTEPEVRDRFFASMIAPYDHVATFELDGAQGRGLLEHNLVGPFPTYGLKGFRDGAPE